MKYKVYLKSGSVVDVDTDIPYVETDSRIFFCESEEQTEKLISSEYTTVGRNLISYFEKSEIAGIEYLKAKTGSLGSGQRKERDKPLDKYGTY